MAGSKGKITDELFQRIYRYSQAHPNKNTCEMFHISPVTLNYIKKAGNYREYRESIRVRSVANRAKYGKTKKVATPKPKAETIESPFKDEPMLTPATELFGKRISVGEDNSSTDEKVKTLEAQIEGLKGELKKTKEKNVKLNAELSVQKSNAHRIEELAHTFTMYMYGGDGDMVYRQKIKEVDDLLAGDAKVFNGLAGQKADETYSKFWNRVVLDGADGKDIAKTTSALGRAHSVFMNLVKDRHKYMLNTLEARSERDEARKGWKQTIDERDQLKDALKKNMELVDDLETKLSNDQTELAAKDEKIKSLEQRVANQRENLKKSEEVAVANERLKDKIAALERVNAAATTFHRELEDYDPVGNDEPITLACQDHAVRNILVGVGITIVVAFATVVLAWLIRGEF